MAQFLANSAEDLMGPKPAVPKSGELFRQPLIDMLNLKHPLVKLAEVIDWDKITQAFSRHFVSDKGRPALPPRLVAGLLYLQHAYDCSDEEIVNTWVENPYVQYFTGETYFQTDIPLDSSSLTRWRQRLGAAGVELLLQITIDAARRIEMIKNTSVNQVIVDTTVMPKAMAYPTDSRLLEQSRQHLVKLAEEHNLCLRQNYNRQAPKLVAQIGRYAHARQYNRMKKAVKTLHTRVGRVYREICRKREAIPEQSQPKAQDLLYRVNRVLTQKIKDKNKLYALHAPEVECISKGKVRTPYEFGVKVSVATTLKEGLIVGMRAMPGNPWDGHTLEQAIQQVSALAQQKPKTVIVDKGYKGVTVEGIQILRSGQRRGITRALKAMIKRRSAIEPTIGHMKSDGRLGRNPLKGGLGDALHAVLCGAGHNIRLLLKKLRLLYAHILLWCAVLRKHPNIMHDAA
jgi:IS5 family transposase